jgi:FkbM family methyltransferase
VISKLLLDLAERALAGTRLETPARLVHLRLAGLGTRHGARSWRYKRAALAIMDRVLAPDSCTVDIGAHRGFFLSRALRLAPDGRHLAVEPIPALGERLRRLYPRAEVVTAACADRVGTSVLLRHPSEPGWSSLRPWAVLVENPGVERLEVPVATLDALVEGWPTLRLVKIDAMGAQVEVLAGARRTLARHRPFVLLYNRLADGDDVEATCRAIWREVHSAGLALSRLEDWLAGRPPLDAAQFLAICGHFEGAEWMFLAHPTS